MKHFLRMLSKWRENGDARRISETKYLYFGGKTKFTKLVVINGNFVLSLSHFLCFVLFYV